MFYPRRSRNTAVWWKGPPNGALGGASRERNHVEWRGIGKSPKLPTLSAVVEAMRQMDCQGW